MPLLLAMLHVAGERRGALARQILGGASLEALCSVPEWAPTEESLRVARRQLAAVAAFDITIVPPSRLPAHLRRAGPPVCLFVRGDASLLERTAVGVIGSRQSSDDAVAWAAAQARAAVERGEVVVSGGARGIDAAAHRAAIEAGGPTVVYLGVAADRVYPSRNRALFRRVLLSGGALVSEHPPGVETWISDHAKRNRFIAAHSRALYIAEADIDSGTLRTADWARKLGVPVWVSPEGVGSRRAGLRALILAGHARVAPGD